MTVDNGIDEELFVFLESQAELSCDGGGMNAPPCNLGEPAKYQARKICPCNTSGVWLIGEMCKNLLLTMEIPPNGWACLDCGKPLVGTRLADNVEILPL